MVSFPNSETQDSCVIEALICEEGQARLLFQISFDDWPDDTYYFVNDLDGNKLLESPYYDYNNATKTIVEQFCVPSNTCLSLHWFDWFGDG